MHRSLPAAALAAALLAAPLAVVPAASAAPTSWIGLQAVSTSVSAASPFGPAGGNPTVVDVNPSGRAVAAWIGSTSAGSLLVARRAPDGVWTAPQLVNTDLPVGGSTIDVAIDDAGDATVLWSAQRPPTGVSSVYSATGLAGGAFANPVRLGNSAVSGTGVADRLDLAMNASGTTVAAWSENFTQAVTYAASSASPGSDWTTPVAISDTTAGHGGTTPQVAINASGDAVATYVDITGSTASDRAYYVRAVRRAAGAAWVATDNGAIGDATSAFPAPPAIDAAGGVTVAYRYQQSLRTTAWAAGGGAPSPYEQITSATACNANDNGLAIGVDGFGTRTVGYLCSGRIATVTSNVGGSFAGTDFGVGYQLLANNPDTAVPILLDVVPAGNALLGVTTNNTTGTARVFRRTPTPAMWGSAEQVVEPDQDLRMEGVGLDAAGDAVALVGKRRSDGPATVYDQFSSVLDLTAPVGGIAGPATAAVGSLVTFTSASSDGFGGFTAPPVWTSSDGGTGSGATFVRTFVAPGTYLVTTSQTDIAGRPANAQKQITITAAAPPGTGPGTPGTPGPPGPPGQTTCTVPKVIGKKVGAAMKAITRAGCVVGKVKGPTTAKPGFALLVAKQKAKASTVVALGAKVKLTVKAVRRT